MDTVTAITTDNNISISTKPNETTSSTKPTSIHHSSQGSSNVDKRKPKKKGKARNQNLYSEYDSITFTKRQSSGRPGSPHRFYASSYTTHFKKEPASPLSTATSTLPASPSPTIIESIEETNLKTGGSVIGTTAAPEPDSSLLTRNSQVVHKHANGLCIVTAGDTIRSIRRQPQTTDDDKDNNRPPLEEGTTTVEPPTITKVTFQTQETDVNSVGAKRKKSKMMRGNGQKKNSGPGVVKPADVVALVTLGDGREVPLRACVSGTIIELNQRLTSESGDGTMEEDKSMAVPSLLVTDPLLDGYLAVIMPNGQFPPPAISSISKQDGVATKDP